MIMRESVKFVGARGWGFLFSLSASVPCSHQCECHHIGAIGARFAL